MSSTLAIIPELLTLREAARLCCVGERTFWRHAHSGLAPRPVKIGGVARYSRQEILKWIKMGCPACPAERQNDH